MNYPKSFKNLIENFRKLPGVGEKTAERYSFQVLDLSKEEINEFIEALEQLRDEVKFCASCGNISDNELCLICEDSARNQKIICVVQSPKDVIAMERIQQFNGLYHVLNGVISTSKGILPEDINIKSLLTRVQNEIEEVILATNLTVEGETTALYIAKMLESKGVIVTRIAHGLPMGGHLDYADELTLTKAIEGRKTMG